MIKIVFIIFFDLFKFLLLIIKLLTSIITLLVTKLKLITLIKAKSIWISSSPKLFFDWWRHEKVVFFFVKLIVKIIYIRFLMHFLKKLRFLILVKILFILFTTHIILSSEKIHLDISPSTKLRRRL